jgi:hypothetical protein
MASYGDSFTSTFYIYRDKFTFYLTSLTTQLLVALVSDSGSLQTTSFEYYRIKVLAHINGKKIQFRFSSVSFKIVSTVLKNIK